jgi:hypothetical protein
MAVVAYALLHLLATEAEEEVSWQVVMEQVYDAKKVA